MTPCRCPEHHDAHLDPDTGWVLTGDEAWLVEDWEMHAGNARQKRYRTPEERTEARRESRRRSAARRRRMDRAAA